MKCCQLNFNYGFKFGRHDNLTTIVSSYLYGFDKTAEKNALTVIRVFGSILEILQKWSTRNMMLT